MRPTATASGAARWRNRWWPSRRRQRCRSRRRPARPRSAAARRGRRGPGSTETAFTWSAATRSGASKRDPRRDRRAPVAALDRVALVARGVLHQRAQARGDRGDVERLGPGRRRTRSRAATGPRRRARPRPAAGSARELDRPAGPAVEQHDRQRRRRPPSLPDEVDSRPSASSGSRSAAPRARASRSPSRPVRAELAQVAEVGAQLPAASPGCSGQRVRAQALAQVVERPRSATRISNGSASPGRSQREAPRRAAGAAACASRPSPSGRGCRRGRPGSTGSRASAPPVGELDAEADVADRLLLGAAVGARDPGDPDAERRRRSAPARRRPSPRRPRARPRRGARSAPGSTPSSSDLGLVRVGDDAAGEVLRGARRRRSAAPRAARRCTTRPGPIRWPAQQLGDLLVDRRPVLG